MTDASPCSVRSTCPYCGVGCGVLLSPDGKGGVTVKGDPDHLANFGRLCSKGSALGETVVPTAACVRHRSTVRRRIGIMRSLWWLTVFVRPCERMDPIAWLSTCRASF